MPEGDKESLQGHLDWLYTGRHPVYEGGQPCKCEHAYKGLGRLYGVNMGKGWVRMTTHPDCPHHGTVAETKRRERLRGHRGR